MRKSLRFLLLGIFVIVLGALIVILSQDKSIKRESPPIAADAGSLESEVPVTGMIIQAGPYQRRVFADGVLEGWRRSLVSSEAGGRVLEWKAEIGDRLALSEPLLRLDDELAKLQLEQANAGLEASQVAVAKNRLDLERLERLLQQGSLTQSDLESARLGLKAAEANLKGAEAACGMAARNLRETQVPMPFSGYLSKRLVEVGQSLPPGTPVAEIVQIDPIRLTLGLSDSDVGLVEPGQSVFIPLANPSRHSLEGQVRAVAVAADAVTRLFAVECQFPNPDRELKPGQSVRAEIIVARFEDVIVVPQDAIQIENSSSYCFAAVQGRTERRSVQLGFNQGGYTQITSGLNNGDTLIVIGQLSVKPAGRIAVSILTPDK